MMVSKSTLTRASVTAVKLLVTGLVGWLVLQHVDLGDVAALLRATDLGLVVLAVALSILRTPVSGWRWQLILGQSGNKIGVWYLTKVTLVSQFFFSVLPGQLGSDVARGYYLFRGKNPPADIVTSIVFDRAVGVAGMLLLAAGPALVLAWDTPQLVPAAYAALAGLTGMVGAFMGLRWWAKRGSGWPGPKQLAQVLAGLADLARRNLTLVRLLGLTLVFQLAGVLVIYWLGQAVGVRVGFSNYVLLIPLIWLVSALPISFGGFGVREGAFVVLFALVGVPAEPALGLGLLVAAVAVFHGLVGGSVALLDRSLKAGARSQAE